MINILLNNVENKIKLVFCINYTKKELLTLFSNIMNLLWNKIVINLPQATWKYLTHGVQYFI